MPGARDDRESIKTGAEFSRLPVSRMPDASNVMHAKQAWETLSAYHKDLPASNRKLHVVYVTFKDRPALPAYKERYDRILKNIQAYYADQMQANGFPPLTFNLDLDDKGKLIIHDAYVDQPMSAMTVQSSGPVSREAAKQVLATKGIDPERSHVLIICQLPDGIGPYYGGGNSRQGTAWTCDQDGLDTKNFIDKTPMPRSRFGGSVGYNATIYIGGTAHELGHAFGLPHTASGAYLKYGHSLMGNGNGYYGEELRGDGLGAFLHYTDALKLASTPMFSRVEVPIPDNTSYGPMMGLYVPGAFENIALSQPDASSDIFLRGKVRMMRPAYGIVVHLDPDGGGDYDACAEGAMIKEDGSFTVKMPKTKHDCYGELRIDILNCDSTRSIFTMPVWQKGASYVAPGLARLNYFAELESLWIKGNKQAALAELTKLEAQYGHEPQFKEWLPIWQRTLSGSNATPTMAPSDVPANQTGVSLHELKPVKAQVGWSRAAWNVLPPSKLGPQPFFANPDSTRRFIFTHAPAVLTYDLGGQWNKFKAVVGLPSGSLGSVCFSVWLDGKEMAKTAVLRTGNSATLEADVKGGKMLEIRVDDGGDGNPADWGIIGEAELQR